MPEGIAWDNGNIKPLREVSLPITDRAIQAGDGLYETMLVREGSVPLVERHIARLRNNCKKLDLPPVSEQNLRTAINDTVHAVRQRGRKKSDSPSSSGTALTPDRFILKILLTAGDGNGLQRADHPSVRLYILPRPYPDITDEWCQSGIILRLQPAAGNTGSDLATVKTISRLGESLALERVRNQWPEKTGVEPLFVGDDNRLLQGAITNVFLFKNDRWLTPPVHDGILPGVSRGLLLEQLPEEATADKPLFTEDLLSAEVAMVSNAVMGPVPVSKVVGASISRPREHPLTFPVPEEPFPPREIWKTCINTEEKPIRTSDA